MPNATEIIAKAGRVPQCKPAEIRSLMKKLHMDERGFAFVMNVAHSTVKLWLHGASQPCNPAKRLMQILGAAPDVLDRICEESEELQ